MVKECRKIDTDATGRELSQNAFRMFDAVSYAGDVHAYIGGCIAAHWHTQIELFCLEEGEVQVDIGDEHLLLHGGEGCFINSEQIHAFHALSGKTSRYISILFAPDIVGGKQGSAFDVRYMQPLLERGTAFAYFPSDSFLLKCFRRAYRALAEEAAGYEFAVRDALSELVLGLLPTISAHPLRRRDELQPHLKVMQQWIQDHLGEKIMVSDIAAAAQISVRECQRIFMRRLHYTPMAYIRICRLNRAADALRHDDRSVTAIALENGFSSSAHFTKQFRDAVGMSPTEYRRSMHEKR